MYFVDLDLAPIQDPETVPGAIAQTLGLRGSTNRPHPGRSGLAFIYEQRVTAVGGATARLPSMHRHLHPPSYVHWSPRQRGPFGFLNGWPPTRLGERDGTVSG